MEEPYVTTVSGEKLHFLKPSPYEIHITDIAHQLSHICRWSGGTKHFFSVAQHSLLVAEMVEAARGSKHEILQGLLHDASEAYMMDLPRPIKRSKPLQGYTKVEKGLQGTILQKYTQNPTLMSKVEEKDLQAQHTEAYYLLDYQPDWQIHYYIDFERGPKHCRKVLPVEIRRRFLDKFLSLM